MSLNSYPLRRIGRLALAELQITQAARVLGTTSRGIFLLSAAQGVVFLSLENNAGPWTANLLGLPPGWQGIPIGKEAHFQAGRIILPFAQAYFDAASASHWQPAEADLAAADPAGLVNRLHETANLMLEGRARGFSPLLAHQLGLESVAIPVELRPVEERIFQLCASLGDKDYPSALMAAEGLLGLGSGLTPSGDDLLVGILLGQARWGAALEIHIPSGFIKGILQSARQRTTALSACLLEAAAAGMADERLLSAADGLFTGKTNPAQIAQALLAYGNSSGVDFLLGLSLLTQ